MNDLLDFDAMPLSIIRSHLSIEIIDDDPEFQQIMREFLREKDFDISEVAVEIPTEDDSSLDSVVERCIAADAVILDLDLGYAHDGFELGHALQQVQPQKWIIVVSGHDKMRNQLNGDHSFSYKAEFSKGDFPGPRLDRVLDELAYKKVRRNRAHEISQAKLLEAAQATNTVDKQLALSAVKEMFKLHLIPRARERNRAQIVTGSGLSSTRYQIVLMIWTALERLSLVAGKTVAVPSDDQLRTLASCVAVLQKTPLTEVHEHEVYDRLRLDGLGLSAELDDPPPPEQLGYQPDEDE